MPVVKFFGWYALTQIYWPVCPYSNLLAGMPLLKFIGLYSLTQIYWLVCPYSNLLAWFTKLECVLYDYQRLELIDVSAICPFQFKTLIFFVFFFCLFFNETLLYPTIAYLQLGTWHQEAYV